MEARDDIALPLHHWAETELRRLACATGSAAIEALDGATLLGERAALNGLRIPGTVSAGGGCRLVTALDGWIAFNLARPDDRELLPALFGDGTLDPNDDGAIERAVAERRRSELLPLGRELGLAMAALDESRPGPAALVMTDGRPRATPLPASPLVIDLSALWAGPLAGHLLGLAGATVVKVESPRRPDAMRDGDPGLFARLNQGKANVAIDLHGRGGRAALLGLIDRADIVIEAARPRALAQLGIDAERIVGQRQGLVWLTITAHGVAGDAANWVGFGDDAGVAGGLSAALLAASGRIGFVGDAIADPLTGIAAARIGWERWASGTGARIALSMRDVVAEALRSERARDADALDANLRQWAAAAGRPFPVPRMRATGPVQPLGADTGAWLGSAPC
ncbi:CoA transferase [Rhizorhabdus dicambivorans]|uniref:CoA transferase n=2 Tax=Rhizorhabdus dicambivorans TaxID=1850238 RepID=A0A2A4FUG1_9SPHN|nr:CoA transferase [Rhizorhabdus dicambivorans]PCE41817.1 CoA transferase [Rhizorhabdus dicambivorans]